MSLYSNFSRRLQELQVQIRVIKFTCLILKHWKVDWLSFITHPLVTTTSVTPRLVEDLDLRLKDESNRNTPPSKLLEYFSRLTSEEIGIFHSWEERNLTQLPLAQCYVQAVNPVS